MKKIISLIFFIYSFLMFSAHAGIYANNLWDHTEISVCFSDPGNFRIENYSLNFQKWELPDKVKIKKWITGNFPAHRTGIHFVGFKDCKDMPDADVAMFYNLDSPFLRRVFNLRTPRGLTPIGMQPVGSIIDHPHARGYVMISTSGMTKRTVVHEFGHLAGLEHEQNHPDAFKKSPKCQYVKAFMKEKPEFHYLDYDKDSAMNYCTFENILNMDSGLSPKDAELLKSLY